MASDDDQRPWQNGDRVVTIASCPHCAGQGVTPYNGDYADTDTPLVKCVHCDGLGDLDAARLLEAYRIGRREVIESIAYYVGRINDITHSSVGELSGKHLQKKVGR